MATAAVPRGRSLIGRGIRIVAERAKAKGRPPKAALWLQEHMFTLAAMSAGVTDGFLHGTGWGLGSLVAALLLIELKVQG